MVGLVDPRTITAVANPRADVALDVAGTKRWR
jgi:hypothetical protein